MATLTTGVASALAVSGLDPITYTEGGGPVPVAPGIVVTGGAFGDGYLQFSVDNATSTEVLYLPSASAPDTTQGAVSVVGTAVYLGTGSGSKQIGTVDAVNNGQAGRPLRVNFSAALENATFSGGVTGSGSAQTPNGWTVNRNLLTLGALASQTQGGTGQGIEKGLSTSTFSSQVVAHSGHDAALRMWFDAQCPGTPYQHPYCSAFGPDAWSAPFDAKAGDALAFDWAAANGSDAYEVYGFLVNTATNAHTELMYSRSAGSAPWTTTDGTIPADGNYRFRFVAGSYDNTGGLALGASLYIDNPRVVSDDANAAVAQSVARMVMYDNSSNDPAPTRTIRFEAQTPTETVAPTTATANVTLVDDAPTLSVPVTATFTNTSAADSFADITGTLSATDPEGDPITYALPGGTANATTIGGVTYTHQVQGAFGTLHLNESTGAYAVVADANAIDAQLTDASETFAISATANGLSDQKSFTLAVSVPASAPGAPTDVLTAPRDGGLDLQWTAPTWLGGSAISGYQIEIAVNGGGWTTAVASTGSDATAYQLTGLTNGDTVEVRVSAINATGTSAPSATVTGHPARVAAAPTDVVATPAPGQVAVTWTAPTDDGGAPITGYRVETSTDGGATWTVAIADTATVATQATVTGLTNGTAVLVRVAARNAAGVGPTGASSAPVTPRSVASAPTITSITPGNRTLTVEFSNPADDGGAPVTGYEYSLDGGTTWIAAGSTSPIVIGPLDNGSSYPVLVRALNAVGAGAPSAVQTATPVLTAVVPADGSPVVAPGEPAALLVDGQERAVRVLTAKDDASIPTDTVRIVGDGFSVDLRGVASDGTGLDVESRGRLVIVRGAFASVSGTGFLPGSTVDVWIMSTPILLGELTVDATGTFAAMLPIPDGIEVGDHTVQLNGIGADDQLRTLSVPVVVLGDTESPFSLPFSGSHASTLVLWSGAMLAAGVMTLVWAKRRNAAVPVPVAERSGD